MPTGCWNWHLLQVNWPNESGTLKTLMNWPRDLGSLPDRGSQFSSSVATDHRIILIDKPTIIYSANRLISLWTYIPIDCPKLAVFSVKIFMKTIPALFSISCPIQEQLSEQLFNAGSVFTVRALCETVSQPIVREPQRICRRQATTQRTTRMQINLMLYINIRLFDSKVNQVEYPSRSHIHHKPQKLYNCCAASTVHQFVLVLKSKTQSESEFSRALSQ